MDNAFETALAKFVSDLQAHVDNHYATKFPMLTPSKISLERGSKFIRVVTTNDGGKGQRSSHCFIVVKGGTTKALGTVKPGDVMKCATWKAPAKHVRGSIFASDFKGYGVSVYGADYLR